MGRAKARVRRAWHPRTELRHVLSRRASSAGFRTNTKAVSYTHLDVYKRQGKGHSSYALYGRKGNRRFSIYVPDELAEELERAIQNGRDLQQLMAEAGRRYTLALKNERNSRNRK